jgi:DNA mismatch endonuclease (patch repair protein)
MGTERMSAEKRSYVMSRIRKTDSKPERKLRAALWTAGVRGWRKNLGSVTGTPDVVFPRWRLSIFVDGTFWHGHPDKFKPGRSGEYWDRKIRRNMQRDKRIAEQLTQDGWMVMRFWEFEVAEELEECVRQIMGALFSRGWRPSAPADRA